MGSTCFGTSLKKFCEDISNIKKSKSITGTKIEYKNTCFTNVKSGRKMIKEIINFAKIKGYSYRQSPKCNQVQLFRNTSANNIHFAVNVIKMKAKRSKC